MIQQSKPYLTNLGCNDPKFSLPTTHVYLLHLQISKVIRSDFCTFAYELW